jgi:pantoate--beta-alanine ligase
MKIIRTVKEMQTIALKLRGENKTIGFVPTMGFLHEGHMELMRAARKENDILILSIFVNPLQFGPNEDFDRYPRDEEHDRMVAEQEKVDYVFLPTVEEMYPYKRTIELKAIDRTNVLCGRTRKGHFDGVITVLTKLFHIIQPNKVYFGLKDAQQVAVVDTLIKEFNFPIELIPIPIVREKDGLAKSSRNVYLSENERKEAKFIYQALTSGLELVKKGETSSNKIVEQVKQFINTNTHGKIDYVELLTYPELKPTDHVQQTVILATAVYFEKARLIDNIIFNEKGEEGYYL